MESKLYRNLALLSFVIALAFAIIFFYSPIAIFPFVGFMCLSVMLVPGWRSDRMGVFNTWNFMMLNVLIGLTLRGIYIYFGLADASLIDYYYLNGRSGEYFIPGAALLVVSIIFMTCGYMFGRIRHIQQAKFGHANQARLFITIFVLSLASAVATYQYIKLTGGVVDGNISAKRTNLSIDDLVSHRTFGPLRLAASLAIFAHLILLADILVSRGRFNAVRIVVCVALFLLACVVPFYASSRTPVAIYFCVSAATIYYITRKTPVLRIVFATGVALLVMGLMTNLRRMSAYNNTRSWFENFDPIQSIVLDRNNIGLAKTSHILDAIPQLLPYQYGSTFWVWLVAWVPRSFWPEKPAIAASAKEIGSTVFGLRIAGVPPGVIAEMQWNFHFLGSVLGMFLLGMLLKYIHEKYKPREEDPHSVLLYVIGPMQVGFLIIGHSLGYGLFNAILNTVIMYLIIRFVCAPRNEYSVSRW